ncbi:putative transporter [Lachnellula subtilissima]|uniref:Putative transporter n=1 Tax=Lachnellula subtilissima TaxID=602034 RepID=A0A8H8U7H5_9HELO|nr:putative transporter [Lachnellula subtilissima]
MFCIVYGIQFLYKTSMSYASVLGLQKDIGLHGQDYSWLGSVFYFGYLQMEFCTGRLLQRLPLGKYIAICTILWGIVNPCFAAVQSYSGAIAVRFFLGVLKASISPGFALVTAQVGLRFEIAAKQSARIGIWVSYNGFAQIFGGLVAYGFAHGNTTSKFAIAPWRAIFLFLGLLTIVAGGVILIFLPDNQLNARCLSKEDRILAVERVRVNQQGIGNKKFKLHQCREAFADPFTWMVVFLNITQTIPNGGLTNFFSQLIVSFGFTPQQSLLYGTPAGAVEIFALIIRGLLSQRSGHRLLFGGGGLVVGLIGAILLVALPVETRVGRLIGYYMTQGFATALSAVLSLVASNTAGYTKKTTVLALFWIGYCVGNIIGPQTFQVKDAPRFASAEITILVLFAIGLVDMLLMYLYLRRQNKKKEQERLQSGCVENEGHEFLNLTN